MLEERLANESSGKAEVLQMQLVAQARYRIDGVPRIFTLRNEEAELGVEKLLRDQKAPFPE